MTFDELKNEVMTAMENKPKQWRNGQFVFNYIDEHYGVARRAQFEKHVDCFYNDDVIDDFIKTCAELFNLNSYSELKLEFIVYDKDELSSEICHSNIKMNFNDNTAVLVNDGAISKICLYKKED